MNNTEKLMYDVKDLLVEAKTGAGRGVGIPTFGGLIDGVDEILKSVAFDYLNMARPFMPFKRIKIEKFNFNNFYSLDIRHDISIIRTEFEKGKNKYKEIFTNIYDDEGYEDKLKYKLREEYKLWFTDLEIEAKAKPSSYNKKTDKVTGSEKVKLYNDVITHHKNDIPLHENDKYWKNPLDSILKDNQYLMLLYNDLAVVSITTESDDEVLAIKRDFFVDLIMDGLMSAIVGNIPQGVTIEEILQGKFSRKAIAPEQGTFINRVKDPTSDKEFKFRSWKEETMKELHQLVLDTFILHPELDKEIIMPLKGIFNKPTRASLVIYITQDNFNRLEKGGQGFSNLVKKGMKAIGDSATIVQAM